MTPSRPELVFVVADALCSRADAGAHGWQEAEHGSAFGPSALAAADVAVTAVLTALAAAADPPRNPHLPQPRSSVAEPAVAALSA